MMKKKKMKKVIPWQEKKDLTDGEEIHLQKDLDQLTCWIEKVDSMDDDQLKEYLHNRPQEFQTLKIRKGHIRQIVKKDDDKKYWASNGIMASVWKFHKQDNDQIPS